MQSGKNIHILHASTNTKRESFETIGHGAVTIWVPDKQATK